MCSPVVVLLGQDQNNQSAVVVLGDEEDRRDIGPGDDISAVIGERQTEYNSFFFFCKYIKCFKKFHPKVRNHGEGPY